MASENNEVDLSSMAASSQAAPASSEAGSASSEADRQSSASNRLAEPQGDSAAEDLPTNSDLTADSANGAGRNNGYRADRRLSGNNDPNEPFAGERVTDAEREVLAEGENKTRNANGAEPDGGRIPSAEGYSAEGYSAEGYKGHSPFRHYRIELKPGEPTDEDLFAQFKAGNGAAFLALYERYHTNLYAYCAKVMYSAGLDHGTVEDAFQEVFLRVAQYQTSFIGGEFRAWVFTIARHTCINIKKKGMRHRLTNEMIADADNPDAYATREARAALSRSDDPLETLSREEQTALLMRAIELLPETYREALMLCDFEGLSYDEIGKVTGTSLSTARIRVYRAKAKLRKILLPIIGDDTFIPGDLDEEDKKV